MFLSGVADEAGSNIDTQIKATRELGWKNFEARVVEVTGYPKGNIHDIPDRAFDILCDKVAASGVKIHCFGSAIANWGKKIDQPFDSSLAEAKRAIPRMQRLGTKFIRIMSFAPREGDDQMEEERFRRLREITKMFLDAGIQPVHENCMNYGGMGWPFAIKLLDNVPGLKWVFDTGNPIFNDDRSKPKPWPKQDSWEFYTHVKPFIAHVHVKDAKWNAVKNDADYTFPGEGDGAVRAIIKDLLASSYDGAISIEPHVAVVFHDASVTASEDKQYSTYVEYGRALEKLIANVRNELSRERSAKKQTVGVS